ncbi:MAG TPA: T9SS type A sorting domain-containing protein [Chitinophagaceae bacterium]|nr:T9SS type A sorting domain-containing protein [Chitinophagaceae bacterium]
MKKKPFILLVILILIGIYLLLQSRNVHLLKNEAELNVFHPTPVRSIIPLNAARNFSPVTFACISNSNPFSAEYTFFDIQLNSNKTVSLIWKTTAETNNDHFEIERSRDENKWISLSSVNPQSSHEYFYTDLFPEDGINFYRIKEIDLDHNIFYSDIKFIRIGKATALSIWPNPVSDNLHVQIPFTGGTIELTDISGRMIGKYVNTSSILIIPVKKLNAGVYMLIIESDREKIVQKFIKE